MSSSSSSSSSPPLCDYDVFLSFRGEDTRNTIVSHLYKELVDASISTFKDDPRIEKGEKISKKLSNAIHNSKFAVVVISEKYATSTWCLEELRLIMELEAQNKIKVYPLFYGIEPTDVRHCRGNFSLNMHKELKKAKMIPKWKEALSGIADLSGAVSSNGVEESKMVQDIVQFISSRVSHILPIDAAFSKEMKKYMEALKPLLDMENSVDKVRMIGIYGVGSVAKTTIAKYLYEQLKQEFPNHHCFMENVGSLSRTPNGILYLQNKLIFYVDGNDTNLNFDNKEEGARFIEERFKNLKVLLVLDNVDDEVQLDYLAKEMSWFGAGSRIIITTRDKSFLDSYGVENMYDVEYLDDEKALQLFKETAFKGKHMYYQYNDLSQRISRLAHGIPSIIEAFGSHLRDKTKVEWEDALKSFEETSQHNNVKGILKVSYESLNTQNSKTRFLHVACLFNGEFLPRVVALFNRLDVSWIRELAEKSLINITTDGLIAMSDLVKEMGKQIVREDSKEKLHKQRILWCHEDIYPIVANQSGTSRTRGVSVDVSKMPGTHIRWDVFRKMSNLIVLKIFNNYEYLKDGLILAGDLYVPCNIRLLDWDSYPYTTLPSTIRQQSLVELILRNSKLTTLWSGTPELLNLRRMDLTGSEHLQQIPDLRNAPYLEELILKGCRALQAIPTSICSLPRLRKIDVSKCRGLNRITIKESETTIFEDRSLAVRSVKLAFSNAETPPATSFKDLSIKGRLTIMFHKVLEGCADQMCFVSEQLTVSMLEQLTPDLMTPPPYACKSLNIMRFPYTRESGRFECPSFSGFPWLIELNLINLKIQKLPDDISQMKALEKLDLSGNDFKDLPTTMSDLKKLKHLALCNCRELEILPGLYQLEKLTLSDCTRLKTLATPPYQRSYSLVELWLDNCKRVVNLCDQLTWLPNLTYLDMSRQDFRTVPTSINNLSSLVTLCLNYCNNLTSVADIPQHVSLKAHGCKLLQTSLPSTDTCLHPNPTQNTSQITRFPAGKRGEEEPMCDCFEKTKRKEESGWSQILDVWERVSPWLFCFVIGTIVVGLHSIVRITGIEPLTTTTTTIIFYIYLCTFLFAIFLHYELESISMRLAERREQTKRILFYFFFPFFLIFFVSFYSLMVIYHYYYVFP